MNKPPADEADVKADSARAGIRAEKLEKPLSGAPAPALLMFDAAEAGACMGDACAIPRRRTEE